jgi:predicted GIY-YIG superfamily endonuclease
MHSQPYFYYVYIMTNRSKTLYTGVRGQLEKRVFEQSAVVMGQLTGSSRAFPRTVTCEVYVTGWPS